MLLVAILVVAVILFLTMNNNQESRKQAQLTSHMEDLGGEFYTELLYGQLKDGRSEEELKEFLQKYEETGFNVSLDNLSRTASDEHKDKLEDFNYNDEACNKDTTRAFIYPQAPFGRDDYRIEVKLDCGFSNTD